jgi:hypothetical protein
MHEVTENVELIYQLQICILSAGGGLNGFFFLVLACPGRISDILLRNYF